MAYKNIYVAASSQHVGKTTSTLGLMQSFVRMGINVGYCKPVGQRYINVGSGRADKDAVLFAEVMGFKLNATIHSPVILGQGATVEFLDHPEWTHYEQRIQYAARYLSQNHELIIYEGTGHPGVGSVVDLSNAKVAKLLDAHVALVVEGGIGNTIDMLSLCLSRFYKEDVPIAGVILNKVRPEKFEKVQEYIQKWLDKEGIPLLGLMPYDENMGYPIMRMVPEAVDGVTIFNEEYLGNKVKEILAGSLLDVDHFKTNSVLLVVAAVRVDHAILKIEKLSKEMGLSESPLAGIIATGIGTIGPACVDYITQHKIPLIRTSLDTYGSVIRVSSIEVKINERTPWKVSRAFEMIENNVSLSSLLIKT